MKKTIIAIMAIAFILLPTPAFASEEVEATDPEADVIIRTVDIDSLNDDSFEVIESEESEDTEATEVLESEELGDSEISEETEPEPAETDDADAIESESLAEELPGTLPVEESGPAAETSCASEPDLESPATDDEIKDEQELDQKSEVPDDEYEDEEEELYEELSPKILEAVSRVKTALRNGECQIDISDIDLHEDQMDILEQYLQISLGDHSFAFYVDGDVIWLVEVEDIAASVPETDTEAEAEVEAEASEPPIRVISDPEWVKDANSMASPESASVPEPAPVNEKVTANSGKKIQAVGPKDPSAAADTEISDTEQTPLSDNTAFPLTELFEKAVLLAATIAAAIKNGGAIC